VPGVAIPETKIVIAGEVVPPAEVSTRLGPLNEAVTPGGAENVMLTGDAKLFREVRYSVTEPDAPWGMEIPDVESASEKSP
jgi:hypothetical protein